MGAMVLEAMLEDCYVSPLKNAKIEPSADVMELISYLVSV